MFKDLRIGRKVYLVVDGVGQKGDQLWSGSFDAEGQSDGRQLFDRV